MATYSERFLGAFEKIDPDALTRQTLIFVLNHIYFSGKDVFCTRRVLKKQLSGDTRVREVLRKLRLLGCRVMETQYGFMATKFDSNQEPAYVILANHHESEFFIITRDEPWVDPAIDEALEGINNRDIPVDHYSYCYECVSFDTTSIPYEYKETWHSSFYPWMTQSMDEYVQDHSESGRNILFIYGAPGTGKTNWLKHYLISKGQKAAVCSDTVALETGDVFTLFGRSDATTLVIEDADSIVGKREDGNKVMAKILNFSNGILSNNRKIVISTNLSNLNKVDPALLRSGRCYKVLHFGLLDQAAANAARASLGLEPYSFDKDVTLADALHVEDPASTERGITGYI